MVTQTNGQFIRSYPSIIEAVCDTGICNGLISRCANGFVKSAGGFLWCRSDPLRQQDRKPACGKKRFSTDEHSENDIGPDGNLGEDSILNNNRRVKFRKKKLKMTIKAHDILEGTYF